MPDEKPDDSRLLGMSPQGWVIVITAAVSVFASSIFMPALQMYFSYQRDLMKIKALESLDTKIESVKQDNSKNHDDLVTAIRETGATATMAVKSAESPEQPADESGPAPLAK